MPPTDLRGDPFDFLHARFGHQHACMGETGLAVVQIARLDRSRDCRREVGVVEDERSGFSAQFKRDTLDRPRTQFADPAPRSGRTRERHHVDFRMRHEGLADHRTIARHEIEDARRKTGFIDHFGEQIRRERRDFGGLEHDGQPAASAGATLAAISVSG